MIESKSLIIVVKGCYLFGIFFALLSNEVEVGVFFKTNFMITLIINIRTTDTQRDWMIFHFEEERDSVCVQKVWTITDIFFYQNETYCIIISNFLCFFFNYINHYQNWNVEVKHIAYVLKLKISRHLKKKWNTFLKHPLI